MPVKKIPAPRMNTKYTLIFVAVLVMIGLAIMTIRYAASEVDSVPVGDRIWKITIEANFKATADSSTLHVALPRQSPYFKIVRQTFTHPNITMKRPPKLSGRFNEIMAVPDQPGDQQLVVELTMHSSDEDRWSNTFQQLSPMSAKRRALFLEDASSMNLSDPAIPNALSKIRSGVADLSSLPQEIYKYIHKHITLMPDLAFSDVPNVLTKMRSNGLGKTMAFVALCRASNIPARLVAGVITQEAIGAEIHYWAEVFDDERWQPYDIEHGYSGELPPNYLALAYNREDISYFEDPTPVQTTIDIETMPASAGMLGKDKKNFVQIIDLTRLDVSTQHLLAVLLILPFGALITQIFRQIVGANMFGTFSAPLLALAMIYADWITVTVIITIVGIFGLGGRAYLAGGLTRVPRLTVVFTLVAMSMVFAVSLMEFFDMNPSANAVLLPIVILVSLIDRIYATQEDYGMTVALHRIAWTVMVAFLCFLIFNMGWLRNLVLIHPEIHFFTLALILLVTLFSDTTLIERSALRWLREPEQKKTGKIRKKESAEEH